MPAASAAMRLEWRALWLCVHRRCLPVRRSIWATTAHAPHDSVARRARDARLYRTRTAEGVVLILKRCPASVEIELNPCMVWLGTALAWASRMDKFAVESTLWLTGHTPWHYGPSAGVQVGRASSHGTVVRMDNSFIEHTYPMQRKPSLALYNGHAAAHKPLATDQIKH